MIFKTHEQNIPQIRALVNAFGGCWVHGDGNMFSDDNDPQGGTYHSSNHKDFCNPKNEERMYRVHYRRGDNLPKTKEQLDRDLMNARNQEILTSRTIKEVSKVKNFAVRDEDIMEPEGEIDYSQYVREPANTKTAKKAK